MTVQDQATTQGIILTEAAAVKVGSLLEQEGRDDLRLRIAVQPGGCSGLRYQLYFDEREIDGDIVSAFGSVKVVTDKMSAPYLSGASIDFVDTNGARAVDRHTPTHTALPRAPAPRPRRVGEEGRGGVLPETDTPNASGSCAC